MLSRKLKAAAEWLQGDHKVSGYFVAAFWFFVLCDLAGWIFT